MKRTLLTADVLLLVFALANRRTKLALLSTCRWLYREGGKKLIKSDRASIKSAKGMRSFIRFMDADGGSRIRFLSHLDMAEFDEDPSKSVVKQFNRIIKRLIPVSQLTHLTIDVLEDLLAAHPPLCKAIAKLTSLKDVSFTEIGILSLRMLTSMRSKVETAYLDLEITHYGPPVGRDEHAIMFLRQFSSSLRDLTVVGGCDSVEPQDGDPQYPLLSALYVENPWPIITWHYVRAFPNLKKLTMVEMQDPVCIITQGAGLPQFRARNVAQLREHGCWESLGTVRGPIVALWLLGLPCPISELELVDDCGIATRVTTDMLHNVLGPARTTRLDICIFPLSLFFDEAFTQAFTEACGDTVKVLILTLRIMSESDELEETQPGDEWVLGDVLDGVGDMLGSWSVLESITLSVDFRKGDESPAEAYAQEMDLDAACAALHEAVPSAKHVKLVLEYHSKRGTKTVEIKSEGSGSKVDK